MEKSGYFYLITALSIISWLLWGIVLLFVAPDDLGLIGVGLFAVTMAAVFFTTFLLILFVIRIKLLKLEPLFRQFNVIFRESLLVTVWLIASLWLTRWRQLNALIFLLMLAAIVIIDLLCIVLYDQKRRQKTRKIVG